MSVQRLTEIVRARWESGAHGGEYLRVSAGALAALRAFAPPSSPQDMAMHLFGVPILLDERLAEGDWRLVDGGDQERLVEYGTIHPDAVGWPS